MCMIDCDDDQVTVLFERIQRALKAHRCMECGRQIDKGETYLCERYVWDGSAKTHKTCEHCTVARDWLNGECGGFIYGRVEEDMREHAYDGYPMDVRRVGRQTVRVIELRQPVPAVRSNA